MDTLTLWLTVLAVFMLAVAWQAHRLGNERRDVRLLAVLAALLGAGSGISVLA